MSHGRRRTRYGRRIHATRVTLVWVFPTVLIVGLVLWGSRLGTFLLGLAGLLAVAWAGAEVARRNSRRPPGVPRGDDRLESLHAAYFMFLLAGTVVGIGLAIALPVVVPTSAVFFWHVMDFAPLVVVVAALGWAIWKVLQAGPLRKRHS